jgi:hypothetical protein
MLNVIFALPQMLQGWHFTGELPVILQREFLFRGFRGRNTMVAVYRGVLYRGLTVFGPKRNEINGDWS